MNLLNHIEVINFLTENDEFKSLDTITVIQCFC